jgi:RuvB-like protein 2
MIMCAALVAKGRKAASVEIDDIRRVYSLFSDLRRSTQFLLEHNSEFMFNEFAVDETEGEGSSSGAAAMDVVA